MKTLDEVIDWYANRKTMLIGKATKEEMEDSILHYLKEYQKFRKALNLKVMGNEPLLEQLINVLRAVRE